MSMNHGALTLMADAIAADKLRDAEKRSCRARLLEALKSDHRAEQRGARAAIGGLLIRTGGKLAGNPAATFVRQPAR
jgi:hypothetical protein